MRWIGLFGLGLVAGPVSGLASWWLLNLKYGPPDEDFGYLGVDTVEFLVVVFAPLVIEGGIAGVLAGRHRVIGWLLVLDGMLIYAWFWTAATTFFTVSDQFFIVAIPITIAYWAPWFIVWVMRGLRDDLARGRASRVQEPITDADD
jgi:hypothetical protein